MLGLAFLLLSLAGCAAQTAPNTATPVPTAEPTQAATEVPGSAPVAQADATPDPATLPTVEFVLEDGQVLRGVLYPHEAPLTVAHFTQLANAGRLDGITFRALLSKLMLQTNLPEDSKDIPSILGEFQNNGYQNDVSHRRGTLSMQHGSNPDSATAQFYICVKDVPGFDGAYAAFGQITEGLDILDQLAALETNTNGLFVTPPRIRTVRVDAKGYPEARESIQAEDMRKMTYPTFTIKLANGGEMKGELYPNMAPNTVANFISLANKGFYDGLIFHRVIPGFVIQGGDPKGTGTGGPGYSIKGEFKSNGVNNTLLHTYGVLSMARSQANDSAGSQFFIMMGTSPHLDGSYAAFGKITEGMEHADKIVAVKTGANDKPVQNQVIESIRVETHGVEYPLQTIQ